MKIHYSRTSLATLLFIVLLLSSQVIYPQTQRDKIAQMIWASFSTSTLHDTTKIDLKERNLGGIILFAGSIKSPTQVRKLIDTIKMFSKTPPFISVDQEGGRVARLNGSNGYKPTNSAYRLGVIGKEDSTRKTAALMAQWLKDAGFNVNLAPVADVNINPVSPAIGKLERSFSSKPDSVFLHTKWFIDEFSKQRILTCLKHFPGHGSAVSDSHLGFTDITNTWSQSELIPYKSLFAENFNGFVMLGHLFNKNLDAVYPASLSKNTVTNFLRNQLGFSSVTITDGMSMQAITLNYGFEESIEYAINAGVDILLYEYNLRNKTSLVKQIIDIVEKKIALGRISANRIDESYNRIIALKKNYGIINSVNVDREKEIPSGFYLSQNYPNPFNPTTTISFTIPVVDAKFASTTYVTLKVYDVLGNEVITLVDDYKQPGFYNCQFSTINYQLSSGIFFYRLTANGYSETKKMILVK